MDKNAPSNVGDLGSISGQKLKSHMQLSLWSTTRERMICGWLGLEIGMGMGVELGIVFRSRNGNQEWSGIGGLPGKVGE